MIELGDIVLVEGLSGFYEVEGIEPNGEEVTISSSVDEHYLVPLEEVLQHYVPSVKV